MSSNATLPFKSAAKQVLSEAGEPLHYRDSTKRALGQKLIATGGKTPAATMNSQIAVDLLRRGRRPTILDSL
jgi:restriction system protein